MNMGTCELDSVVWDLLDTGYFGDLGSHITVQYTHPVELPRWARRLSHASELPSHSIYCRDKQKEKIGKSKGNLIKCRCQLS